MYMSPVLFYTVYNLLNNTICHFVTQTKVVREDVTDSLCFKELKNDKKCHPINYDITRFQELKITMKKGFVQEDHSMSTTVTK